MDNIIIKRIGGTTRASLVHGNFDTDTDIIDGNFTNKLVTGNATAQVGGASVFGLDAPLPLLKVDGSFHELHAKKCRKPIRFIL